MKGLAAEGGSSERCKGGETLPASNARIFLSFSISCYLVEEVQRIPENRLPVVLLLTNIVRKGGGLGATAVWGKTIARGAMARYLI